MNIEDLKARVLRFIAEDKKRAIALGVFFLVALFFLIASAFSAREETPVNCADPSVSELECWQRLELR